MASAKTEGLSFEMNGDRFKLFGYEAVIPDPGDKTFLVMSCLGVLAKVNVPAPILPKILGTIEKDKSDGKLSKIKYVLLNANHAGYLLIGHALSPQQFADAEEEELFNGKYGPCIILKPMKFGEHEFPVIIVDADDEKGYPAFATLDESGDVV